MNEIRFERKKRNAMLMLLCFLFAILTIPAHAQSRQRITLEMKSATVEQVIKRLQETTRYKFSFNEQDLQQTPVRNYAFQNATINKVMEELVANTSLEWSETNGTIVLSKKTAVKSEPRIGVGVIRNSISGRVTDEKGQPLTGVSILLKGRNTVRTLTDANGNYTLPMPSNPPFIGVPVLQYFFLGREPKEKEVRNEEKCDVTMESVSVEIEEVKVVSTGYQEISRERMTGSSQTITAKDIENSAFMSIDAILSGKIAGLYSSQTTGAPGASSEIRIRGDNSISGNMEPLWVLDGLPLQAGVMSIEGITAGNVQQSILDHGIGTLAPTDIESVTVLKDAAATAIYGARAANGVIVIKTKQGKDGPLTINYQGNYAITSAPRMSTYDFMNAEQKVQHEIELMEEFRITGVLGGAGKLWEEWQKGMISTDEYNMQLDQLRKVKVNWFDELYRTSFSHNHSLSIRGGTDKYWFYSSLNALDEKGALITNRYTNLSTSINVGFRPHENTTVDFRLNGSYRESKDHASSVDPFKYAIFANPYEKPYNEDGSYAWDDSFLDNNKSSLHSGDKYSTFNILREMAETYRKDIASDLFATLSLNWQIIPDLKAEIHGRIGYATNNGETAAGVGTYASYANYFSTMPFSSTTSATGGELPEEYNKGYFRGNFGRSTSFSYRAGLSYSKDIEERHFITAYLGNEVSSRETWNDAFRTAQYDMQYYFVGYPEFPWIPDFTTNLGGDLAKMSSHVYGGKDRTVSVFGALTYSYMDRYVVNANARFDGAGTIDPKNRFTPLWSVSGRWNLHREKFFESISSVFSELAIRAVYGYTGNIDRNALPYSYIRLASYQYDNEYVAGKVFFPNPSIKWEKKQDRNIGIDYSFFRNRIGGSFNYYNNRTEGVLGKTSAPNSALNTKPIMNLHTVTNTGIEFIINTRLKINDMMWVSQFNVARNKNVITKSTYPTIQDFTDNSASGYWTGYSGPIEGYQTGATFGYRFAGVDPTTGNAMIYLSEDARRVYAEGKGIDISEAPLTWDPGLNPGLSESRDKWMMRSMAMIGNTQPKYVGGFSTSLSWKRFDLRANFNYAVGHIIRTFDERQNAYSSSARQSEIYASRHNRLAIAANRWKTPGDITDYPRYSTESTTYFTLLTDNKFQKGDYLNFNNLSLTYNIPVEFLDMFGIQHCRIGFQVQNVYAWSRFRSTDVTTGSAFGYPNTRKFLLNVQAMF